MAFLHAHAATTASGTGTTVGITVTAVTAGNLIILGTVRAVNTITDSSVTDNASTPNAYLKSAGPIDNGATRRVTQWYGVATTGGATTVTLTQSTSGTSVTLVCDEFSGNALTNATVFDKVVTNTGSGTALSVSLSPTNPGELIVASGSAPGGTLAAGTNYALGSNNGNTSGNWYRLLGTTSETAPATAVTSAWVEIASAFNPLVTTQFIEAGTAETQDFTFWTTETGATGLVTSDAQAVNSSVRSIKSTSGSGNDFSGVFRNNTFSSVSGRFSMWLRFSGTISSSGNGADIIGVDTNAGVTIFSVGVNNAGKIVLLNGAGTASGTSTATVSANTDFRISCAYSVFSSTVNTITVYLNGVSVISVSNITLGTGTINALYLGNGVNQNTSGANVTFYFAHIFVDNGTVGDPGNISVTAKRPFSNGTTNGFTGSGTPSGYGTGNARYVNERPLSTSNFVSVVGAGSAVTEEYNIEGASVGDNNLTGATIVDYLGWLYTKTLIAETGKIILNNVQTNISITTSASLFTQIAGSTSYPAGTGTDIGEITSTTVTTVTLYEAGIMVAYIPGVSGTQYYSFLPTLGVG